MTVLLTITNMGVDLDELDLYSDINGYAVPFEINVPKASLVSGYTTSLVPDYTNVVRVQSKNACVNYLDIILSNIP